jgi:transmembrane 9 superfamily protein 3
MIRYQRSRSIILFAGILPFGSIFIEMYFIFTSFWTTKIYYVYGFMLLIFVLLLIVTSCVSLVATCRLFSVICDWFQKDLQEADQILL